MKILKRGKLVYYIKDESVVVKINSFQYVAYNTYMLQNRRPFYEFKKALLESREDEYGTVVEEIELAQKYKLKAVGTSAPEVEM